MRGVMKKNTLAVFCLILSALLCRPVSITELSHTVAVPKAQAADPGFNPNNLINDQTFTNVDSMNTAEIQTFLNSQGGFLKDYSEGGRTAAQIIFDAAHGYGDATGSINGI